MFNQQNILGLKVVYNARQNAIGLLIDQFVLWHETCYYKPVGAKNICCLKLESMVEFDSEWTLIDDL